MKKMIRVSMFYLVLALVGGVFYREFTKLNGFDGVTVLADLHVHFMVLGVFMFLILALFAQRTNLLQEKRFSQFMIVYNGGLLLTVVMLCVRGITQVLETPLSRGVNAAISGIAGIGHICLGIGLFMLLLTLLKVADKEV